jgi:hypothetical protein
MPFTFGFNFTAAAPAVRARCCGFACSRFVEMQVAKGVDEISRLQSANLCDRGFADGSQESTIFRFPECRS